MIEVFYSVARGENHIVGSQRFINDCEFVEWLADALIRGAVLITKVHYV